ncbi:Respiratory-chain NADH dehydrogenase domain 51 kDa subunit [Desulfovibrio sp. X2]|uniref:complex I 51 kDa subunit family protein n=1 Tax=Desulfovibrio sp. X2 TaxID=941449 RepID=UPI000358B0D2|nr:NADH-ubiquinone oxidoreductase-F iron-sulfur binding region domain-containing protein [Desulfovibrio sp. X2]EPR43561.1 Respiratory-chain NADH dehydrogenase domain 51 kDa subunit [Desulfovibrio sp. X2]
MSELVLFKNRREGRAATFDEYRASGGYEALIDAVKNRTPGDVVRIVTESGLRGRGGAGFPTGRKWGSVHGDGGPRYILPNTDEMEPGTFKDRVLVNTDPHLVVEGIILAAYAVGACHGIFFIRPSYEQDAKVLERELSIAREAGFLGRNILGSDFSFDIDVHRSAGRYICGEASAQVNAIQGKRPNPIKVGEHLTETGLWGRPTVVNNVETLASVPHILKNGVPWFKSLAATPEGDGTKLYCVSGMVGAPGCYELPMGTALGDIIFEHGGGMLPGKDFKACLPGGASSGLMPASLLHVPMDFDAMKKAGQRLGTASIVVFDQETCLVGACLNLIGFFVRESCGWCTPCREGLPFIQEVLWRIEQGEGEERDIELLRETLDLMRYSYCAFAPGAAAPVEGLLRYFEDEVREHIRIKGCPFSASARCLSAPAPSTDAEDPAAREGCDLSTRRQEG